MKKLICLIVIVGLFVGCSKENNLMITMNRPAITDKDQFRTICLDGVTYYMFRETAGYAGFGYMSVKLDRNSKIVKCEEK